MTAARPARRHRTTPAATTNVPPIDLEESA
jgi:hypothetical protein